MTGKWAWVQVVSLVGLLSVMPAWAEHEMFYRYVVLGYVKNSRQAPRAGIRIRLTREKTGFSYLAETDSQGFFIIVARLGDESVGERLTVAAGALVTTITARFDPGNHRDERGTRLDFVGRRVVESPKLFAGTLRRFLAP